MLVYHVQDAALPRLRGGIPVVPGGIGGVLFEPFADLRGI